MMSSAISISNCPICEDRFSPPIYQCTNGHVICRYCIGRMATCGECRCPLAQPPIRNLVLEHLCSSLPVKCPGEAEGCRVVGTLAEIQIHSRNCEHWSFDFSMQMLQLEPRFIIWKPHSGHSCGEWPDFGVQADVDSNGTYERLYVARAYRNRGVFPGSLRTGSLAVTIGYGLRTFESSDYEVLVAPRRSVSWVDCQNDNIPSNAIPGGHDPAGETYYVGRALHKGRLAVGKVHPSHRSCYVPDDHTEYAYNNYEILVQI